MTDAIGSALEALTRPRETATGRRASLLGGFLLLAGVNYLDLTGVLGWALSSSTVNWLGVAWLLLHLAVMDSDGFKGELRQAVADLLRLVLAGVLLLLWAAYQRPEASVRYLSYATPTGLLGTALDQAVLPAFVVAVGGTVLIAVLDWLEEYRRLSRTTPEERVLEDG